ncbi:MAG TPA: hypothetical protein PLD14_01680 [Candidatus Pacearchaeota archaeon]|nr:hypothetical protein [Candidatus Pacearchaeota archaeon]HPR79909.1 hypothetical protein [Candidatus Pacearchaeota archaeon]
MIDTICLLIPKNKMLYLSGISSWELYSKTEYYAKFVRNPSKLEKETKKYFPRLTEYRRNQYNANVRIEFSIPKLLYLNNLDELEDNDFLKVIEKLQYRLKDMGVIVQKPILENASVSSVHFSKNILLQDGYTASHLISEINKVNLPKSFDFAKTRFINDGQSIYAHATSHQLVIYDKIADLAKDKKRAIDKEQTHYQKSLFSELNKKNELQEIIRFEVRLNHKQKMNKIIEDLGYQKNPTFKEIFNTELSKKVVNDYWRKLIKERSLGLFSISISVKDMLQILFLADRTMKPKQAIYLLGLFMLAKDENGMRQLRTILSKRSTERNWYRIVKDLQQSSTLITQNKIQDWVTQIDKALEDYKPYKIKNYETS